MESQDERLRRQVVKEADRLFFSLGFGPATMDELSRRLRMSKKTLYRLFESKEDLLRAVLLALIQEVEQGTEAIYSDPSLGFIEKLHHLFAFIGRHIVKLRQPVLDDIQRSARDVWEDFDAWRQQRVLAKFGRLIRQGVAEGFIRKDLNPELLALMYATLVRRVINPETLTEMPITATQAFETIIAVFFEGILTPPARSSYESSRAAARAASESAEWPSRTSSGNSGNSA